MDINNCGIKNCDTRTATQIETNQNVCQAKCDFLIPSSNVTLYQLFLATPFHISFTKKNDKYGTECLNILHYMKQDGIQDLVYDTSCILWSFLAHFLDLTLTLFP